MSRAASQAFVLQARRLGVLALLAWVPFARAQQPARADAQPHSAVMGVARELRASPGRWLTPNVDDAVPLVQPSVTCPLPEVLAGASQRVKELATNLESFGATEEILHEDLDKSGQPHHHEKLSFTYLVTLQEIRPGFLAVDELRNGGVFPDAFPAQVVTNGLAASAFIFHPYYLGDFAMTCEGLGAWQGEPAWQVRFEQRPDRPSRIHGFFVRGRSYAVKLKGRAWIAEKTLQIVRIETDPMEPISEIRLEGEHIAITYAPVEFHEKKVALWLPESADLYLDFHGHRFHRRHAFTKYVLFSVDVSQQIKSPVEP